MLTRIRRKRRVERRDVLTAPLSELFRNLSPAFFPSGSRLCNTPLLNVWRLPASERLAPAQVLAGDGQCVNRCRQPRDSARAAAFHAGYVRGLPEFARLHRSEGVPPEASPLGEMLADATAESLPALGRSFPIVISVPWHAGKRRERGFNQAKCVACAAAKRMPQPHTVSARVLVRKRATQTQVGRAREQRLQNMRGAFRAAAPARSGERNVIFVDHAASTGTTLSERARVLRFARAKRVWAATVARTSSSAMPCEHADYREEERGEAAVAATALL